MGLVRSRWGNIFTDRSQHFCRETMWTCKSRAWSSRCAMPCWEDGRQLCHPRFGLDVVGTSAYCTTAAQCFAGSGSTSLYQSAMPTTAACCRAMEPSRRSQQWRFEERECRSQRILVSSFMMLMHCAKVADVHSANLPNANPAPSIPLAVIVAWSRSALNLGLEVGHDSYKALAATTAMAMQQLSACDAELLEMKSALQGMLEFTIGPGDAGTSQKDMSHLENWHLDSCLQALAVLDTLDEKLHPGVKDPSRLYWKQLFWLKLVAQQGFRSSKRITWSFGNVCWTRCLATALPRGSRFSWKRFSVKRSFRRFHEQYAQPFETSCPVWKIKIGCGKWVHIAQTQTLGFE